MISNVLFERYMKEKKTIISLRITFDLITQKNAKALDSDQKRIQAHVRSSNTMTI